MNFVVLSIFAWVAAMGAWFLVSKYFKSSDLDRIKQRLSGTTRAKANKKAKGEPAEQRVIQQVLVPKNRLAQMLVEKSNLGPKLKTFLDQAGLPWQPAGFVHGSLLLFLAGTAVGWVLLPVARPLCLVVGLVGSVCPFLYVHFKRKSRLKHFEEHFPEALEFVSRSMRAGHALLGIARDDSSRVSGASCGRVPAHLRGA